jgi:hypothetical protein
VLSVTTGCAAITDMFPRPDCLAESIPLTCPAKAAVR